ncbi:MAG TPA: ATP-dependent DNA ligase, partial [Burkholderiales bacterium]|nr:ATP-dependent DNA ligase [Burkholderiales bacterium]
MTLLVEVVRASAAVAATSSRLAKVRVIADCLRALAPDEIEIALPWLSGDLRQGKLALAYAALKSATGNPAAAAGLTVKEADGVFQGLKTIKGKGAAAAREGELKNLFGKATAEEQDFLLRLIVGELRQGALEGVMLEAVAAAAQLPAAEIRRAATHAGGIAQVARAALTGGKDALRQFEIKLMQPVLPMLAQPAEDVAAALKDLGRALLEWKLDGARIQVHKDRDQVRVFTRNLNDVTARVPEVVSALKDVPCSLILDGEAIALRSDGRPHPFQVTMRRFGRKLEDQALRRELPLSVFFFDCLLRDGTTLMDAGAGERRKALEQSLPAALLTPSLVTDDVTRAEAFYADALARGHEGLMAKALEAPYEAGRRGAGWLKIKSAHTLDLVVIAVEWGSGRRKGWLSNLHLGARDPGSGGFVMLGKTFKGLTDEMLVWQTERLLELERERSEHTVYVRPE